MSEKEPTRTVVVQEATRSLRITIPHEAVDQLDIDDGDSLLVKPVGDDELRVKKSESVWND